MNQNENEILAQNNMRLEKADFIEFQKAVRKKTAKIAFFVVIAAAVIIYIVVGISAWKKIDIRGAERDVLLVTVCLLLSIFMYMVFPLWLGKTRYQQYCTIHSSRGKMVFYADRLETVVGEEAIQKLYYADIRRTVQSENLLIIEFANKVYAIIRKDGFTEGDAENVLGILEKRRD